MATSEILSVSKANFGLKASGFALLTTSSMVRLKL